MNRSMSSYIRIFDICEILAKFSLNYSNFDIWIFCSWKLPISSWCSPMQRYRLFLWHFIGFNCNLQLISVAKMKYLIPIFLFWRGWSLPQGVVSSSQVNLIIFYLSFLFLFVIGTISSIRNLNSSILDIVEGIQE